MYRARRNVADHQVRERAGPGAAAAKESGEPGEEEAKCDELGPPPPATTAIALGLKGGLEEVAVRIGVEVEAGEGQDNVKELVLERDEELAEGVEGHLALVVRGPQRVEENGRDREEGEVLDVGVAVGGSGKELASEGHCTY